MILMGLSSSRAGDTLVLVDEIETALNSSSEGTLSNFFDVEQSSDLLLRFRRLKTRFPDARWLLKPSSKLQDGRSTLEVFINGSTKLKEQDYHFQSKQILAFRTRKEKIIDQELLFEESILRSNNHLIPITLQIPDAVLTGSRYDIDVLFDEPLGESIVAAGLIDLTSKQINGDESPEILLAPMHGGGLFKSVLAPLVPGTQTWAILLAHTNGIISVTKLVRVVPTEEELAIN